jgi:Tfp pilus assembly protein PilF
LKYMSTQYEVFFSYAHRDEDWCEKLEIYLTTLQKENYIQIWRDRNILAGSERESEILVRLSTAPIILLLVSQDFIASESCWSVQLSQAMHRHEAGTARVIPIIIHPCDWQTTPLTKLQVLPENGKPLSTWPNEREALLQVALGIRHVVKQMREQPQAIQSAPGREERTRPLVLKKRWNVPLRQNPFFTGREDLLTRLHTSLAQPHTTALSQPQAISGFGGVGKTQIALEYAYRYQNDYQAVLWVRASTQKQLTKDVAALARILDLPAQRSSKQQESIEAVKQWLTTNARWLLIFDNADDLSLLSDYLSSQPKGHVLVTTRADAMSGIAQKLEVPQMDEPEGVRFLLHRAGLIDQQTTPEETYQQAREIFYLLGGLPLALDQAGAYIEETHESLQHYITLYQTQRRELHKRRGGIRSDHLPVATTWTLALRTIERSNPAAIELMHLCAFLAPDAIPEQMILASTKHLTPLLQSITQERTQWNNALADLLKYSLIQRNPATMSLSIHRLLQAVIKDEMNTQQQEAWKTCVVLLMNSVFPFNEDVPWTQNQEYLPHAILATEYIFQHRGHFKQVEPLYQHAIFIRERTLGPNHPDTIIALNNLANLYCSQGKLDQAEPFYLHILTSRERTLGPNHPDTAKALNNLANLYRNQGKLDQAEPLFQRALSICEWILNPNHPDTAKALNNLALLYRNQGKFEQAEPLFQRALNIQQHVLGPDHPDTAKTCNNLALLYRDQGKFDKAEILFQHILTTGENFLTPEHPTIAKILNNLALLYADQGKFEQAEPLYKRALNIQECALGPNHPDTASTCNNLALLYRDQGFFEQALLLFQRSLTIRESVLGPDHADTIKVRQNYQKLQKMKRRR